MIKIAFLGDIMPGGVITGQSKDYISDELINYLSKFDLVIGNLECPLGESFPFDEKKMKREKARNIVFAKEVDIDKLKTLKLDAVSLANNHIFDLSEEGFLNTIKVLEKNDIKYFGAGLNLADAIKPLIISVNNKKIGFLGYNDIGWFAPHLPETNKPGINFFKIDKAIEEIKYWKQKVDYLFIYTHWGIEHSYFPTKTNCQEAKKMINAGADGIIGGHPHIIQPTICYKKRPVFFSLGNFLFPDRYITKPRVSYYPSKDDIKKKSFPITYEYSFVQEPTLKLWNQSARVGMIAEIRINKRITYSTTYTFLDSSNRVIRYKISMILSLYLSLIGLFTKYFTNSFSFFVRAVKFVGRKLKFK